MHLPHDLRSLCSANKNPSPHFGQERFFTLPPSYILWRDLPDFFFAAFVSAIIYHFFSAGAAASFFFFGFFLRTSKNVRVFSSL